MKNNNNNLPTHNFQNRIYYVSSLTDKTVVLAIDPVMKNDMLFWFDTVKERIKPIFEIINDSEKKFHFIAYNEREVSDEYIFIPLTVDIYERYVKQRLKNSIAYQNERHLFSLILLTKESAY